MQQEVGLKQTAGAENEDAAAKAASKERKRVIRKECRVVIQMLVRCSSGYSEEWSTDKVEIKGRLLDMNMEGVKLRTRESFIPEQELRLTLQMPNRPPVAAMALVRWCKPLPEKEGEYATGVQFTRIGNDGLKTLHGFFKELRDASQN